MTDVLAPKYEELKEIFAKCGEEMEWEAIEKEAVKSHDVIQKFTTLNDEFTKRVKEENREMDIKNMNEKEQPGTLRKRNIRKGGG
ncbi:hypothetical protein RhiirA5_438370 [Rhizophagus irregularis]|uniref:Uncharacterized protein n=1 Tax=Rhizophagus irregularis TaxID=588596 RepID=A0A2N0NJ70_9GLOM|nr:hypothetical protein RhiirA5_438370 [Rhizophagus irregularis]